MITATLTPEQYAAKSEQLFDEQRIVISGNQGQVVRDGVILAYTYQDGTLQVDVLKTPPFMRNHIVSEITAWLAA